jgi:hypothetical protein
MSATSKRFILRDNETGNEYPVDEPIPDDIKRDVLGDAFDDDDAFDEDDDDELFACPAERQVETLRALVDRLAGICEDLNRRIGALEKKAE